MKGWTFNGPHRCPDDWGYAPDVGPTSFPQRLPDYEGDANLWAAMLKEMAENAAIFTLHRDCESLAYIITICDCPPHKDIKIINEDIAVAVIEAWIAGKEGA